MTEQLRIGPAIEIPEQRPASELISITQMQKAINQEPYTDPHSGVALSIAIGASVLAVVFSLALLIAKNSEKNRTRPRRYSRSNGRVKDIKSTRPKRRK